MLRLARVAAVHPEDHSVDLVMVDDGSRYVGAQVLAPTAGTNSGVFDMPEPTAIGDKWTLSERRDDDMMAVCSMLAGAGLPVVLGFLFPQVNGMLFADKNRRVMRHASDVYTSIDGDGNMEVAHPNGSYVRIGVTPGHEDLTGQDFDGNWKITKNVGKNTHLQVVVKAGGVEKAKIHIDPSGNVTLEHAGNLVIETTGTADVTAAGAATVTAPSVMMDTPAATCTGSLTVQGGLTVTGAFTNNGKDVGSGHVHIGVQSGPSNTGVPA